MLVSRQKVCLVNFHSCVRNRVLREQPLLEQRPTFPGNASTQAVRCWADETLQWEMDSRFELAVRKPTKLISLPVMHLIVGLEERGSFVR